ncbi:MAG: hypothetical protein ACKOX3_08500 [Bacteroidota bacterium]
MKKNLLLTLVSAMLVSNMVQAGSADSTKTVKYRRSSLDMILIESDNFPQKETVINAYVNAPFPEKYNNHSVKKPAFNPAQFTVTDEEREKAGVGKSATGKLLASAGSDATNGLVDSNAADMPIIIDKYVTQNKIANKLVAKWFNRQANGAFDMSLISERGFYNASEMEANIAKGSTRGVASLGDAGEELINNTFVVFTKLKFVANEPVARAIRDLAIANASKAGMGADLVIAGANKVYEKTKEGYSVWTTSYLYKLTWNDSIAAIFYQDYWVDKDHLDKKKIAAFDTTSLFSLEFVGDEKASSLVTFSLKEKRTEEQIITLSTVRNVDAVFSKLQKKYEVFKPKVPLYTGFPITAKIGMKEGLEGGEKFEVLEQTMDPKTGRTVYEKRGTIKVEKDMIWDNRYNAGETTDPATDSAAATPVIDRTTFSGGKNYYSGMLIRQLK